MPSPWVTRALNNDIPATGFAGRAAEELALSRDEAGRVHVTLRHLIAEMDRCWDAAIEEPENVSLWLAYDDAADAVAEVEELSA